MVGIGLFGIWRRVTRSVHEGFVSTRFSIFHGPSPIIYLYMLHTYNNVSDSLALIGEGRGAPF